MSLEGWGNLAAFAEGATEGYQKQSELSMKRKALEEEMRLKKLALDYENYQKGLIQKDDGGWDLSPQEKQKRDLDNLYKQSQIGLNKDRGEYYRQGGAKGSEIKAILEGIEKDPLGNLVPGKYLQDKRKLELDYTKAKMDKELGNVKVPEAESVAAKNKAEADATIAKLLKQGYKLLPDGKLQAPATPPLTDLQDALVKEAASQGYIYDPITGKTTKMPWAKKPKEKEKKTIPATQAINLSSGKAAIAAMKDLENIINKNEHEFGLKAGLINKGKAFFGGKGATTARTLQSDLQTRGQILSKFLEQGKLSDKDREFYLSQVPTLTDSPETARNKIKTLSRIVQQLHNENLEGLGDAGYDVSSFEEIPLTSVRALKTEKSGDDRMVELAKKALSSPKATPTQKENARKFLQSKGIQ